MDDIARSLREAAVGGDTRVSDGVSIVDSGTGPSEKPKRTRGPNGVTDDGERLVENGGAGAAE